MPWLLLDNEEMPHVGSMDVDISLDAEALGDGEYVTLVQALMGHGYEQRAGFRRFQLVRTVEANDGGPPIDVVVDFLMPREVDIVKNGPPIVPDFAAQRADGAELATNFYQFVAIEGSMPDGGRNRVEIAVCSIPALLAMKGHARKIASSRKTPTTSITASAYFEGGPDALAEACRPLTCARELRPAVTVSLRRNLIRADGFRTRLTSAASCKDTQSALADRTAEQWQQDAFGQVDAWWPALGLRG